MNYGPIYDLLRDKVIDLPVDEVVIGQTWTLTTAQDSSGQIYSGLAMNMGGSSRTLPWSGTLKGKSLNTLADWIVSWDLFESSIALSAINASINIKSDLPAQSITLNKSAAPNLSVFEYFLPRLLNKNIVVVGRYPGLEKYEKILNMTVLERDPGKNDLPSAASEFIIKDADWVFLTATSLMNKTFPRLAELSKDANLVLMGPSVPWLPELADFGVDFLAGVEINNNDLLKQVVSEGGGVRIFDDAVNYQILDLGQKEMEWHHMAISDLVSRRESLKAEMEKWYNVSGMGRFPKQGELLQIDKDLSSFDSQYKRLWDARHVPAQQLNSIRP